MESQRLIVQPMYTDDQCGRYVGLFEQHAPLRDFLTVAGEDDCFGRVRWNVHRDLTSTVVLEVLSDKLPRDCAGGFGGRPLGLTCLAVAASVCLLLHGVISMPALPGSCYDQSILTAFDHSGRGDDE